MSDPARDEKLQSLLDYAKAARGSMPDQEWRRKIALACGSDQESRDWIIAQFDIVSSGPEFSPAVLVATGGHSNEPSDKPPSIPGYTIGQKLGNGAMGAVYVGQEVHPPQRTVALKLVQNVELNHELRLRLELEAVALGKLTHPNIVQVHGYLPQPACLVTEFIDGTTLDKYARNKEHQFDSKTIAALFAPLASALAHAHEAGILHRDIKPANIMISSKGSTPKLIDFGIAQIKGRTLHTGMNLGTLGFQDPALSDPKVAPKEQTDIYSLGVSAYWTATGYLPNDPAKKVEWHLSRDLELIIQRCLDFDLNWRFASARDVEAEFTRFAEKSPIESRPKSWAYRAKRNIQRNPLAWVFSTLAIALVVSSAVIARVQTEKKTEIEEQKKIVDQKNLELNKSNEELDRTKHFRSLELAKKALDEHDGKLARQLFHKVRQSRYGWEWDYFDRRLGGTITETPGETEDASEFSELKYTPDGNRLVGISESIAFAGNNPALFPASPDVQTAKSVTLSIWNARDARLIASWSSTKDETLLSALLSADRKFAILVFTKSTDATNRRTVKLLEIASQIIIATFDCPIMPRWCCVAGGKYLFVYCSSSLGTERNDAKELEIELFRVTLDGGTKVPFMIGSLPLFDFQISPDGQSLWAVESQFPTPFEKKYQGRLLNWNVESPKMNDPKIGVQKLFQPNFRPFAISHNGRYSVATTEKGTLRYYSGIFQTELSTETQQTEAVMKRPLYSRLIGFQDDGETLLIVTTDDFHMSRSLLLRHIKTLQDTELPFLDDRLAFQNELSRNGEYLIVPAGNISAPTMRMNRIFAAMSLKDHSSSLLLPNKTLSRVSKTGLPQNFPLEIHPDGKTWVEPYGARCIGIHQFSKATSLNIADNRHGNYVCTGYSSDGSQFGLLSASQTFRNNALIQDTRNYSIIDSVTGNVHSRIKIPTGWDLATTTTDGPPILYQIETHDQKIAIRRNSSEKPVLTYERSKSCKLRTGVIWNSEGVPIVTIDDDGIRKWDPITGKEIWQRQELVQPITAGSIGYGYELKNLFDTTHWNCLLSPDHTLLAYYRPGDPGTVVIVDAKTNRTHYEYPCDSPTLPLAFSPDSSKLLVSLGSVCKILDMKLPARNSVQAIETLGYSLTAISISPDNSRLLTAIQNTVTVWDLETNQQVFTLKQPQVVNGIRFHPQGKQIIIQHSNQLPSIEFIRD